MNTNNLSNLFCAAVLVLLVNLAIKISAAPNIVQTTRPNPVFQKLKCYQCFNERENTNCSRPSDLKECNNAYTANVCLTRVDFDQQQGRRITKECSTGPCSLGKQRSAALGLFDNCDRNKPSWSCTHCCNESGCNVSSGTTFVGQANLIAFLIILLLGA